MALNNFLGYPQYYPNFTQPTQPQQNSITWVQGLAGAKSYLVSPNNTVQLWDSEAQTIYLKSADSSGMPSMKIVDYTMRDNGTTRSEITSQRDFATKDDVLSIQKEIDALKAKIEGEKYE